jgi:hypothetical protein
MPSHPAGQFFLCALSSSLPPLSFSLPFLYALSLMFHYSCNFHSNVFFMYILSLLLIVCNVRHSLLPISGWVNFTTSQWWPQQQFPFSVLPPNPDSFTSGITLSGGIHSCFSITSTVTWTQTLPEFKLNITREPLKPQTPTCLYCLAAIEHCFHSPQW